MSNGRLRLLAVPALGVIFGDIGTSPLYTLRECFAYTGLPLTPDSLLAVLSLIFWSLTIVVSVKYVLTLLRFDYRGEGGVLAMLSLILRNVRRTPWLATAAMALGAFAAALFFGDAMITPAISVLAANLAAAYGLAVSAHLVIGTVLLTVAAISRGNRRSRHDAQASAADVGRLAAIPRAAWLLLLPLGSYLVVELAFLAANLRKLTDGGWFPLLVAVALALVMWVWRSGIDSLRARRDLGPRGLIDGLTLDLGGAARVPGDAVFLSSTATGCPSSFLHNLKHNKVVHDRTCFLTVLFDDAPRLDDASRMTIERGTNGILRLVARFGFREDPDISLILRLARAEGLDLREQSTSFFTSKPHVVVERGQASATLHRRLFGWMLQNSPSVASYMGLPPDRVIEIGARIAL